jgi:hypothetical protein
MFSDAEESHGFAESNLRINMYYHHGGPGSSPGLVVWDMWWTKWRWGKISPSTSVSPVNLYSTSYFTITIIYHLELVQ